MSGPVNSPGDDPLLQAIRDLPAEPLGDVAAERIRRRTRAAFEEQLARAAAPPSFLERADRIWSRAVMPTLVAATICVYFGWAVRTAAALYH